MKIETIANETYEIRRDGNLWGFAIKATRWWVVFEKDWEGGDLEKIGPVDSLDEIAGLIERREGETV